MDKIKPEEINMSSFSSFLSHKMNLSFFLSNIATHVLRWQDYYRFFKFYFTTNFAVKEDNSGLRIEFIDS